MAGRVAPYRASYLPEDRRKTEGDLFEGRLLGVTTTKRDGAGHRHRGPGRHRADRVPGKHSQHVAAGGQKRPGRRAVSERARGPGQPSRPVSDEVSGRLFRQAHRERAHISGEPVRPQAPPALRRLRGAAHDVRHRLLRSRPAAGIRRDGGRRPTGGEGRTVAPATRRLVSPHRT